MRTEAVLGVFVVALVLHVPHPLFVALAVVVLGLVTPEKGHKGARRAH